MRADLYLAQTGYAESRSRARELIEKGCVTLDGRPIKKPSEPVAEGEHAVVIVGQSRYVGRGGYKLEAALNAFSIDVTGRSALDIGASTGGFTDCLLQHGAAHVIAVDAGSGQLAGRLLSDPRVTSLEHLNARDLLPDDIGGETAELIVMDVSFISASYILPRFPALLPPRGEAVVLIKPQFEVGKSRIGKGGIVKDPSAHREAVERVLSAGEAVGLTPVGLISSPIEGGDGNREFLVHFVKDPQGRGPLSQTEICRVTAAKPHAERRPFDAEDRIDHKF